MTPEQEKKLNELYAFKQKLEASFSIPRNVEDAFRVRLGGLGLALSAHTGETQAVNESGSATYSVMSPADGFTQITIGTTTIYIPYFT